MLSNSIQILIALRVGYCALPLIGLDADCWEGGRIVLTYMGEAVLAVIYGGFQEWGVKKEGT